MTSTAVLQGPAKVDCDVRGSCRPSLASRISRPCGDRIVCFFCPASPHFVYHILFMGGEDELSAVMEGEKLGGQEAVLPLHG
jgi:hypothetical protein